MDNKDHLKLARDRFKQCQEAESENRERALEADRFSAGLQQWPEDLKRDRELDDRPCLVMDEINQYINQIKNDQRQNKASIKVRPVDDKADKKVAEMLQGVIRHIEDNSSADAAYDTAFEQALRGGFGYFRISTDYCYEDSFDQEIKIERIRDRFSVYMDPARQLADGSDSRFAFVTEWVERDEFKKLYPKADPISWKEEQKEMPDWATEESIRIAEYFFIKETQAELYQLPDGSTAFGDELNGVDTSGLKKRTTTIKNVVWQKITGAEIIEETEWMGEFIPIVEVIGNEAIVDGKRVLSGIVTAAMDAQKMHNMAISAMVENIMLAPKSPHVAAAGQLEGYEKQWADANHRNIAVLTYNPVEVGGTVLGAPQRQQPPGLSSGWAEIVMASRTWVQSTMGMYNASVGAEGNEKSGRAILAKQREGDTANFHYHDNLSRSIRHSGRILIDLIPKIYDTRRIVRILGDDGQPEAIMFDPQLEMPSKEGQHQDGSAMMLYNPTIGKYDVSVSTGPSYSTKRQEAAETQMQLVQANPAMFPIVGDIMIRNMDWPGADEMADRLQAMLPDQIKALKEKPDETAIEQKAAQLQQVEQGLMQKAQALFEKEQQMQQAEQVLNESAQTTAKDREELESLKTELNALKAEIDADSRILNADKARVVAELKLTQAQGAAATAEKEEGIRQLVPELPQLTEAIMTVMKENRTIMEGMQQIHDDVTGLIMAHKAPKEISYQNGEVDSVGGRQATYDEQGNIIGLSGLN